jgi:hypothetical protein
VTSVRLTLVMSPNVVSRTSTVLLASGSDGRIVAERPRWRDRLAARWRARRLDRALADGASPEASVALALRAQRLTESDRRWAIAGALRRVIREVDEGQRAVVGRIALNRGAVNAASHELRRLADTLDGPGPVAAPGVAQAWLLLTDGTGPLYSEHSRVALSARAAHAADQLRPWAA